MISPLYRSLTHVFGRPLAAVCVESEEPCHQGVQKRELIGGNIWCQGKRLSRFMNAKLKEEEKGETHSS